MIPPPFTRPGKLFAYSGLLANAAGAVLAVLGAIGEQPTIGLFGMIVFLHGFAMLGVSIASCAASAMHLKNGMNESTCWRIALPIWSDCCRRIRIPASDRRHDRVARQFGRMKGKAAA